MCGIFGVLSYGDVSFNKAESIRKAVRRLLEESEARGRRASGLSILTDKGVYVFKDRLSGGQLIHTSGYGTMLKQIHYNKGFKAVIGHTRMPTKGTEYNNVNNHPIVTNRIIGVHNGVISNDDGLFDKYEHKVKRNGEVDSEIIFQLIGYYRGLGQSLINSVEMAHEQLFGSYACAFIDVKNDRYVTLFTNRRDLSVHLFEAQKIIVFGSTHFIVRKALKKNPLFDLKYSRTRHELSCSVVRVDLKTGSMHRSPLEGKAEDMYGGMVY